MTDRDKLLIGYRVLAATLFLDVVASATLTLKVGDSLLIFAFALVSLLNLAFFLAALAVINDAKEVPK